LTAIPGLQDVVKNHQTDMDPEGTLLLMEFILFGLAEFSFLSKHYLEYGLQFKDLLSSMLTLSEEEEDEWVLRMECVNSCGAHSYTLITEDEYDDWVKATRTDPLLLCDVSDVYELTWKEEDNVINLEEEAEIILTEIEYDFTKRFKPY